MSYKLELKPKAIKSLKAIDVKSRRLIAAFLDELQQCDNPKEFKDVKKLAGVEDGYRWRVGVYRILGTVKDNVVTITIFRIGHRKDVYRRL
jgi:mRNA interferase RelE/StbE